MTKTKTDSPIFQKFCVDDCWDVCDWIFFAFLKIGKPILELQKQPQNLILKNKNWAFFLYGKSTHQMGWKKKIIFKNVKKTDFVQCFFNVCENDQRNFWIVWECWIMWECELVTCWWWPSSFHTDVIFAQETTVACWPAA